MGVRSTARPGQRWLLCQRSLADDTPNDWGNGPPRSAKPGAYFAGTQLVTLPSLVTVQTAVFPHAFVSITIFQTPGFAAVLPTMSASMPIL